MLLCDINNVCLIIIIVVCLFVINSNTFYFKNAEDSPCTTNKKKPGVCKKIDECDNIDVNNPHKVCALVDGVPIVCCPNSQQNLKEKCMKYSKIKREKLVQRVIPVIYGGDLVTSVQEFPHQVNLGYLNKEKPTFNCGGSLITEEWILTAAHCINTRAWGKPLVADMGLINQQEPNKFGTYQRINITETHPHPLFTASLRYNDIALIKLEKSVELSSAVIPACLYENSKILEKSAAASGWGMTETNQRSEILLKVLLNIVDDDACVQAYVNQFDRKLIDGIKSESQFCAGRLNKDTCSGDSGGPLQIEADGVSRIVGVTSFGGAQGCATINGTKGSNKVGVYTRVSHYLSWIEGVVS